jgi:hypothetical protein
MLKCWPATLIYNATTLFQADKYSAVTLGLPTTYFANWTGRIGYPYAQV